MKATREPRKVLPVKFERQSFDGRMADVVTMSDDSVKIRFDDGEMLMLMPPDYPAPARQSEQKAGRRRG